MKRRDLLERHGCAFKREGAEHSIWENSSTGQISAIPRHREILEFTAARICKQLGVPLPTR